MTFKPLMDAAPHLMDARIFNPEPMGLRDILLGVPLEQLLTYDAKANILFANFEGFAVRDTQTVKEIEALVENIMAPLKHKVSAVANYDNFEIYPQVFGDYVDMVLRLKARFFEATSVYTTSAFMRMKLGDCASGPRYGPSYSLDSRGGNGRAWRHLQTPILILERKLQT